MPGCHRVGAVSAARPSPVNNPVVRYSGIYKADGGLVGEARYIVGHLLRLTECSLCDITHSPLRRKPQWDSFVANLGVPFPVLHRNELDEELTVAIRDRQLPIVLAHRADGSLEVALDADQLAELDGSIERFSHALAAGRL